MSELGGGGRAAGDAPPQTDNPAAYGGSGFWGTTGYIGTGAHSEQEDSAPVPTPAVDGGQTAAFEDTRAAVAAEYAAAMGDPLRGLAPDPDAPLLEHPHPQVLADDADLARHGAPDPDAIWDDVEAGRLPQTAAEAAADLARHGAPDPDAPYLPDLDDSEVAPPVPDDPPDLPAEPADDAAPAPAPPIDGDRP